MPGEIEMCKTCGMVIIRGGRYPDQIAQEHGFCGEGCEEVFEAQKVADFKDASKGVV